MSTLEEYEEPIEQTINDLSNQLLINANEIYETKRDDVSKSFSDFRNLENGFMMDNGYIIFDFNDKNTDTSKQLILKDLLINSITTNISSNLISFDELTHDNVCGVYDNYDNLSKYSMFVCVIKSDTIMHMLPGSHHWKIDHTHQCHQCHYRKYKHSSNITKNNIIFLHTRLINTIKFDNPEHIEWYGAMFEQNNNVIDCANTNVLWNGWNIFLKRGDFIPLYDLNVKMSTFFKANPQLYQDFSDLELSGWGEFVKLTPESVVFRVKPMNINAKLNKNSETCLTLGKPSIYESTVEIVYFFDMKERLTHTNYTHINVFEVRTGGVLGKLCNVLFTRELYSACCTIKNDETSFVFDVNAIVNFFKNIDYNALIKKWYPFDTIKSTNTIDDIDIDIEIKLSVKKLYSVFVYKFDYLDQKNIPRIRMILSWLKELDLRGGFIVSDSTKNITKTMPGYMIVSGEDTVLTHNKNKTGKLAVFQNRFKCFHWKKVKFFHYSNHDFIASLNYFKLPKLHFCLTWQTAQLLKNTKYSDIASIPEMF